MKYKKFILVLLFYFIVVLIFVNYANNDITLKYFYSNIIFIIIYLFIFNLFINNKVSLLLQLYKFKNRHNYYIYNIKKFTIDNVIVNLGIILINSFIIKIKCDHIDLYLVFYYFFNMFIIMEIMYMIIISFSFKKAFNVVRYFLLVIFLIMFNFAGFDFSVTPLNIFKYLIYKGELYLLIIHYLIWVYGCYLLLDYNSKVIEI